jgi:hypothetical protein
MMVRGTVAHADNLETGVVVNGVVALVYNGVFVANHVPLDIGENIITVQATDVNGEVAKPETISLTVEATDRYVNLTANTEIGLAPFDTTLHYYTNFPRNVAPVISHSGPGDITLTEGSSADTARVSMSTPGIYIFSLELDDTGGTVYNDKVGVLLFDRQELDSHLQEKWSGMKQSLLSGQITDAVQFFMKSSRKVYQQQYEFLAGKGILSQIINTMGTFRLVEHDGFGAIYDLRTTHNDVEYSFQVLFVQDSDGIWRIKNY